LLKRILVPTDGSGHARKAIELATDMALQYDATLYLLHVVSESKIPKEVLDYIKVEKIDEVPERVYLQKIGEGIVAAAERDAKKKGVKEVKNGVNPPFAKLPGDDLAHALHRAHRAEDPRVWMCLI